MPLAKKARDYRARFKGTERLIQKGNTTFTIIFSYNRERTVAETMEFEKPLSVVGFL